MKFLTGPISFEFLKGFAFGVRLSPLLLILSCNSRWQQLPRVDSFVEQPNTISEPKLKKKN